MNLPGVKTPSTKANVPLADRANVFLHLAIAHAGETAIVLVQTPEALCKACRLRLATPPPQRMS